MERTSCHKFHDDGKSGRSLTCPQEQHHIGMAKAVHDKYFSSECLHCLRGGPTTAKQLQ